MGKISLPKEQFSARKSRFLEPFLNLQNFVVLLTLYPIPSRYHRLQTEIEFTITILKKRKDTFLLSSGTFFIIFCNWTKIIFLKSDRLSLWRGSNISCGASTFSLSYIRFFITVFYIVKHMDFQKLINSEIFLSLLWIRIWVFIFDSLSKL